MHSLFNDQMHVHVVLRRAYTVNTGYRCNNDCVVSFKYCPGCRMPHSVYIVINKWWLVNICDHIRNCECLSGPCNAQKNLVFNPVFNASCKLIYCIWLITLWSKRGNKLEFIHTNILNDFYTLLGGYGI